MNTHQWEQAPWSGITTAYRAGKQIMEFCYIQAIETAGGLPVIIPMMKSTTAIQTLTARLDGLVIVGGPAITNGLLGELPNDINLTDPVRISSDNKVLELFLERDGTCSGNLLWDAVN